MGANWISDLTTNGFRVQAAPKYVPEESSPEKKVFFFAYTIRITNVGERVATLRSRHWFITDGRGLVEEVRGPGVVGEEPRLAPGESFEYTSACPLSTPKGRMSGTYQMEAEGGEIFPIQVGAFDLQAPRNLSARPRESDKVLH